MSNRNVSVQLQGLRDEVHNRLLAESEDYRALVALDQAIRQIKTVNVPMTAYVVSTAPAPQITKTPSQAEAVLQVLQETLEPQRTTALLDAIAAKGVSVSGKNPQINLSSALSRDKRLKSVTVDGERMWWFADRPLPGVGLLKEETADPSPSGSSAASKSETSTEE